MGCDEVGDLDIVDNNRIIKVVELRSASPDAGPNSADVRASRCEVPIGSECDSAAGVGSMRNIADCSAMEVQRRFPSERPGGQGNLKAILGMQMAQDVQRRVSDHVERNARREEERSRAAREERN
eukprot:IDg5347t1